MRIRQKEMREVEELVAVQCDRCGHRVEAGDIEGGYDEFHTFSGGGGYASKFWGDCTRWWVDLCESCTYQLFRDFANIDE